MQIKEVDIQLLAEKSNSVFLSEKWLMLFGSELLCYGIFNKANQLVGGFTMRLEKKLGFVNFYHNLQYTPTINLFFENKAQNKAKLLSENKKMLKLFADFIDKLPYHIITLYLPANHIDMQPFYWKDYKAIPNFTYIVNLNRDIQEIEKDYSTERRNDIKKAIKDGVTTKICTDYKTVKSLITNTFDRKDAAMDEQMINKILFEFANKDNSFAFVSHRNNLPIATSFCIYDNDKAYYLLGGYDSKNKHAGAGAMAVSEAIKHSKQLGISKFDFEGSMLPEVERYFRGFGGDLTPYYSINKAKLPIEIALKFVKRTHF